MTARGRVLVTGADQHQGLAVIRGLGMAGVPVIAAGSETASLGFASRYATESRVYASPFQDPERCTADLLALIRELRPAVVIPSVESTLVLLNAVRREVERYTILAAPPAEILEVALDKARTLELAGRCGVPAPRTARGETVDALLDAANHLTFPVAIKPRGHALHRGTAHTVNFKSRYAATPTALRELLIPLARDAPVLLVQECVRGVGRCVSAVCDRGRPLALFAYARDREVPLSGGVSVVRRSIPLDEPLRRHTTALLARLQWHGVAMVEYKYASDTGRYTLMEINGRFQASTALSLDAGLNLPFLVASLFARWPLPAVPPYRTGVEERWLRGDLLALAGAWGLAAAVELPDPATRVGRWAATWHFLRDFRAAMHYDEFKWSDRRPGAVEFRTLCRLGLGWCADRLAGIRRRLGPSATPPAPRPGATPVHFRWKMRKRSDPLPSGLVSGSSPRGG